MGRKVTKPTFTIRECAWTSDNYVTRTLKYQARGEYNGRGISGDPAPTKEKAVENWRKEVEAWGKAWAKLAELAQWDDDALLPKARRDKVTLIDFD